MDKDAIRHKLSAALAEIVDIAGLLIHEVTQLGHIFDALYECQANSMFGLHYLKCACFMNSWIFSARVTRDLALPLPLFPNREQGFSGDDVNKPVSWQDETRDRFDFRADESWYFRYDTTESACSPASLEVTHWDLWAEAHVASVEWRYPGICESATAPESAWGFSVMR